MRQSAVIIGASEFLMKSVGFSATEVGLESRESPQPHRWKAGAVPAASPDTPRAAGRKDHVRPRKERRHWSGTAAAAPRPAESPGRDHTATDRLPGRTRQ